jgi:hypothetical protein
MAFKCSVFIYKISETVLWAGIVGHTYNLSYLVGRDRRITVEASPGKIVIETLSQTKPDIVVHICNPSCLRGAGRRIMV